MNEFFATLRPPITIFLMAGTLTTSKCAKKTRHCIGHPDGFSHSCNCYIFLAQLGILVCRKKCSIEFENWLTNKNKSGQKQF